MSAQTAQGPWYYKADDSDWGFIRDSAGHLVAICKGGTEAEWAEHRRNKTDPYKDNARLIAAAPDLFQALKDALPYIGAYEAPDWILCDAKAAIAKAEGGAE